MLYIVDLRLTSDDDSKCMQHTKKKCAYLRCVNISFKILKNIIGLLKNYIWSRNTHYKTRAKVV